MSFAGNVRPRRRVRQLGGRRDRLGDLGMNANAIAAQAIINAAPPGSGVDPIGVDPRYPLRPNDQVYGFDPIVGFDHWMDWYYANPVPDPSGLFVWTNGGGGYQPNPGLSYAQALAAEVIANGGDTSFSADFHSGNTQELNNGVPDGYQPSTATPGSPDAQLPVPVTNDPNNPGQYIPATPQNTGNGGTDSRVTTGTITYDPPTNSYVPATIDSTGTVIIDPQSSGLTPLSSSSGGGGVRSWSTSKKVAAAAAVAGGFWFLLRRR